MNLIPGHVRGVLSLSLYFINTIFWSIPIFAGALFKLVIPVAPWRRFIDTFLNRLANNWVYINNLNQNILCNIKWDVRGTEKLKKKDWYLIVANHQSWVDILVLQNIFYGKIPFLKFFLKKELFWIPVLGQAWWALDFPFMKRYSKSHIKKKPHLKGKDMEITRKACEKFKTIPVSIMNFVEGTRFTQKKHSQQRSPYEHLLKTRAGGIAFTLGVMGQHLHRVLDVTIVYTEGAKSFWAFLCGRVRNIKVRVRSLPITEKLLGDYANDRNFRVEFHAWLNILWTEKDKCIEKILTQKEINDVGKVGRS